MYKKILKIILNFVELQIIEEPQLSLIRSTRLMRRMLDKKYCKLGLSLTLLSNLDHIYGLKYLTVFPVMYSIKSGYMRILVGDTWMTDH